MHPLKFAVLIVLVSMNALVWGNLATTWPQPVALPAPAVEVRERPAVDIHRITHYQAVVGQTDSTPNISSCGPNRPNQVAVSRDLMGTVVECGTEVMLYSEEDGYLGTFVVWDLTNKRFRSTIDVLTEVPAPWGKTYGHLVVKEN